jgi:ParB-like chromosome segregation protein Spo0J
MKDDHARADVRELPTTMIALDQLLAGESLRSSGINADHVRVLMDCDGELPPILVQQSTMRVIDGMHRLFAARAKGYDEIRAHLLDVNDTTAFLYGVAANISHGLPLSLSDRKSAALRVMRLYPDWSDRALGRACGLSGKTVAALRAPQESDLAASDRRIGLDGRARPVDGSAGRRLVRAILERKPEAPLRQIAKEAGVSAGTVRKVRDDMGLRANRSHGAAPVRPADEAARQRVVPSEYAQRGHPARMEIDPERILNNLRRDPSLKYRAKGRDLLRLLYRGPVLALGKDVVDAVPAHCIPAVARLTRLYAQEWLALSTLLENRARKDAA